MRPAETEARPIRHRGGNSERKCNHCCSNSSLGSADRNELEPWRRRSAPTSNLNDDETQNTTLTTALSFLFVVLGDLSDVDRGRNRGGGGPAMAKGVGGHGERAEADSKQLEARRVSAHGGLRCGGSRSQWGDSQAQARPF